MKVDIFGYIMGLEIFRRNFRAKDISDSELHISQQLSKNNEGIIHF